MAGSKLPFAPGDVRGLRMGNYEVLCRLSTGGMAEIFLASKRGLAGFTKPVVLKKILPDIQGQEEFVEMFLDEAKVTAAFNHPHIAQVFDLDVDDGELFLAMEFVPGATLIEVARACRAANEPMPPGFGLAAVRDTALALHYAHTFTDALGQSSPVIHRDVAEKNIMVTYEGVTKLLDFGIAKSLSAVSRTAAGMVKGTSGYMSPEQILGEPLDARSDLFSLGVVLHECLTGMRLFPGKAPMAVVNAVLKGPIPEPSRANKAIPPELDAIVLKALARKRADRYATTLEFARALERAMGPLIWLPEQSSELMRRLFAERREQTRQLLASGRAGVDSTGVVKLAQLFPDRDAPATPPPASRPEETELVSYSVVTKPPTSLPGEKRTASSSQLAATPPPPPQETGVRPPAQPASRSRPIRTPVDPSTLPSLPVLVEPPRPVRSPTPKEQTRAEPRARSLGRSEAVPALQEPRESSQKTAIIRPPRATPTGEQPVTSDETLPRYDATRAARRPSLSHLDAVTLPTGSPTSAPGPSAPPARALPPEAPTVPAARSPLARPPVVPEDDDEPELLTAPFLAPPSASSRPLPLEPEDDDEDELRTAPFLVPPSASSRPPRVEPDDEDELRTIPILAPLPGASRTLPGPRNEEPDEEDLTPAHPHSISRKHLPAKPQEDEEEGEEELAASGAASSEPSRRGVLWAALLLLLLVGGLAALVVLRLDGGLLSSRLFPPPPEAPARAAQPGDSAPPAPVTPEAAPAPAATPEATAPTTALAPAPSEVSAATGTGSPEAKNEAPPESGAVAEASPKEEEAPAGTPAPQAEAPESTQPAKRGKVAPSRRTARGSAPATVETSSGKGSLTLVTEPYAKVYLGSRSLGETPLFRVPLAPGKHTLRLVAPHFKPLKLQVEIQAGEVTSIRAPLEKLRE